MIINLHKAELFPFCLCRAEDGKEPVFMFDYPARWERAREEIRRRGLDALVISPSQDLEYLTGLGQRYMGWTAFLVISVEHTHFLVSEFEREMYLSTPAGHAECIGWVRGESAVGKLAQLLQGCSRVAVCSALPTGSFLSLQELLPGTAWVNADGVMDALRVVKDAREIAILREAQQKAEAALYRVFAEGIRGLTEHQVADKIMRYRLELGFDTVKPGIVASGAGTAEPHHFNSDRVIESGDIVMCDIGGIYKGYCADITRTVAVDWVPEGFQEIYDLCLEAHMAAARGARPNMTCSELDGLARKVITDGGYGDKFMHSLGHGTGLGLHEKPTVNTGVTEPIAPGTVFTIEPGIYLEGKYGVRIEDLFVMTEEGAETFNLTDKHLTIVH